MNSQLLTAALLCVSKGWFVFPLKPNSKAPDGALAPNGFESASNDPAQIEAWWAASPNANIGIDLGRSNLTVLDFDNCAPPAELGLPETLTVKTSRGTHVYFQGVSQQGDMELDGQHLGEIKSAGGYVLGSASQHPSGATYDVAKIANIAALPDGLIHNLTVRFGRLAERCPGSRGGWGGTGDSGEGKCYKTRNGPRLGWLLSGLFRKVGRGKGYRIGRM